MLLTLKIYPDGRNGSIAKYRGNIYEVWEFPSPMYRFDSKYQNFYTENQKFFLKNGLYSHIVTGSFCKATAEVFYLENVICI